MTAIIEYSDVVYDERSSTMIIWHLNKDMSKKRIRIKIDDFLDGNISYKDVSENPSYNWDDIPDKEMSLEETLEWVQTEDELIVYNDEGEEKVSTLKPVKIENR